MSATTAIERPRSRSISNGAPPDRPPRAPSRGSNRAERPSTSSGDGDQRPLSPLTPPTHVPNVERPSPSSPFSDWEAYIVSQTQNWDEHRLKLTKGGPGRVMWADQLKQSNAPPYIKARDKAVTSPVPGSSSSTTSTASTVSLPPTPSLPSAQPAVGLGLGVNPPPTNSLSLVTPKPLRQSLQLGTTNSASASPNLSSESPISPSSRTSSHGADSYIHYGSNKRSSIQSSTSRETNSSLASTVSTAQTSRFSSASLSDIGHKSPQSPVPGSGGKDLATIAAGLTRPRPNSPSSHKPGRPDFLQTYGLHEDSDESMSIYSRDSHAGQESDEENDFDRFAHRHSFPLPHDDLDEAIRVARVLPNDLEPFVLRQSNRSRSSAIAITESPRPGSLAHRKSLNRKDLTVRPPSPNASILSEAWASSGIDTPTGRGSSNLPYPVSSSSESSSPSSGASSAVDLLPATDQVFIADLPLTISPDLHRIAKDRQTKPRSNSSNSSQSSLTKRKLRSPISSSGSFVRRSVASFTSSSTLSAPEATPVMSASPVMGGTPKFGQSSPRFSSEGSKVAGDDSSSSTLSRSSSLGKVGGRLEKKNRSSRRRILASSCDSMASLTRNYPSTSSDPAEADDESTTDEENGGDDAAGAQQRLEPPMEADEEEVEEEEEGEEEEDQDEEDEDEEDDDALTEATHTTARMVPQFHRKASDLVKSSEMTREPEPEPVADSSFSTERSQAFSPIPFRQDDTDHTPLPAPYTGKDRAGLVAAWEELEVIRYLEGFGKDVRSVRSVGLLDCAEFGGVEGWPKREEWSSFSAYMLAYTTALINRLSTDYIDTVYKNKPLLADEFDSGMLQASAERLYLGCIPLYESVGRSLIGLATWEQPVVTVLAGSVYSYCWYHGQLLPAFFIGLALYIVQLGVMPPGAKVLRRVVDMERSRLGAVRAGREPGYGHGLGHGRGQGVQPDVAAHGARVHAFLTSLADAQERIKNLALWRSPGASLYLVLVLCALGVCSTLLTPWMTVRLPGLLIGAVLFGAPLPLRFLSRVPTDAQHAMTLLRRQDDQLASAYSATFANSDTGGHLLVLSTRVVFQEAKFSATLEEINRLEKKGSHTLVLGMRGGREATFENVQRRDEAFNRIVAIAPQQWH